MKIAMARKQHEKPDNRILIGRIVLQKSEEQFRIVQPEITTYGLYVYSYIITSFNYKLSNEHVYNKSKLQTKIRGNIHSSN